MFIKPLIKEKGILHFTLIDPDKQSHQIAAEIAAKVESFGSDGIMIGGSTAGFDETDKATLAIKAKCQLPIILFPSRATGISKHADYIFWMMLLNTFNRKFLVGEQMKAAPFIQKSGIKTIPMGYIVVSTSTIPTTVEQVGDIDKLLEEDLDKTIAYALTAQYFGMECVYLEAGSGADKPVPSKMISAVKAALKIPLIIGGGIKTAKAAKEAVSAGADVIVTGTIAEKNIEKLGKIIAAVKEN